ncbi:Hypothetical predicted protein [Octopus vulgaris]|uniref:WKF domain-containing protein n=1 Tax=Octopus vulgaris TaxID=6645 RepID=A0AA36B3K9_OCTVU|nr:Hypothetical predicted protein [Octopus vulgaris]
MKLCISNLDQMTIHNTPGPEPKSGNNFCESLPADKLCPFILIHCKRVAALPWLLASNKFYFTVNKKPQKKEQKGPKESKVTEAPSQGKDKNVNAVPASDAEKKKKQQKKKPNGLKAEDGNTQNHVEGNVKAPKQKKSEENAAGELTKKKTQKQQKEATTPTPKTGQTNALKEPVKKKTKHKQPKEETTTTAKAGQNNTSGETLQNGSAGEEPVKKKKKHKQQKEETTPTPKTGQNNALKEPANKKKKHQKEETTTTAKAGQNNTSSASKENGKKKKSNNSGETLQNGSAGEEKKKKRSKRRKGSKADDKPKEMILGEDEATTEKKAKQFLNVWYTNKTEWNFVKARQNWLVHHMYDPEKIPDTTFQTLLKYLAGMKGRSREETKKQAQSLLDAVTKDKNALHKKIKLSGEPGLIQRTRAEQVIQIL